MKKEIQIRFNSFEMFIVGLFFFLSGTVITYTFENNYHFGHIYGFMLFFSSGIMILKKRVKIKKQIK